MKEKIINTKNILKIILIILIIYSTIKSCSKAYTWEDFGDFIKYTRTNQISCSNTSYNETRARLDNNFGTIGSGIESQGYSLSDYNGFTIYNSGSATDPNYVCLFSNASFSCNSVGLISITGTGIAVRFTRDGVIRSINNTSGQTSYYALVDGNPTNNNFYDCIMQNKWNYVSLLPRNNLTINNLPWYIADVKIAENNPNANIYLYLGDNQTTNITLNELSSVGGKLYQVNINSVTGLVNGGTYEIRIYNNDNLLNNPEDFILEWNGSIIPEPTPTPEHDAIISGNYSSGNLSIDLTPINESINNIPDKIGKVFYNSGDSGEKGIFQQIYEDLFTIDSGDVKEIIENIVENTNIENYGLYEEISGELAILTGEPSDFIISWEPVIYENAILIPSGEINFSQKVRETPALQSILDWVHILMGYAVIITIIAGYFETTMKLLGVGTSIYDDQEDEKSRLEAQTETKTYTTEVILPSGKSKSYITRRRRL